MKRVVVIGSGLGGLSAASILARCGYDVTVVEQQSRPGGCLQCFSRAGVRFETGMHYIGSALPGQPLHQLMQLYELNDKLNLVALDHEGYDIINIAGQEFPIANGRDGFIDALAQYFPAEKDNLNRYFNAVETVASALTLGNLTGGFNANALRAAQYHTTALDSVVDSMFTDPLLRKVVVGNMPLYAGVKGRTPFSQHAFIHDFYNQSAFRICGGSDAIATELIRNIERYGSRLLTSAKATRIITDQSKAAAVEINGNETLPADIVVAAIHPSPLIDLLGDTPLLRPVFKRRMQSLPASLSVFSLYLKFKPDTIKYRNNNYYAYRNDPWSCQELDSDGLHQGYLYMHFCDRPRQEFANAGVLIAYMPYELVAPWKGTPINRRGDNYRQLMDLYARKLIQRAAEDFPELPDSIEQYYTSSPLTYEDYTSTPQGAMYGVAKDVTLGAAGRVSHVTRIPNLFLAGQNVNSHGMLGVLIGTTLTAADIIGIDKLKELI